MAVEIRRNPAGELIRSTWWCRIQSKGVRTSFSLGIPIKGKAPSSWIPSVKKWPMGDKGDKWFEESRAAAEDAYLKLRANPPQPKTVDLGEAFTKAFKAQKKHKYRIVKIKDILKHYEKTFAEAGYPIPATAYANWQRNIVARFVQWWKNSGRSAKTPFFDVSAEDAQAFIAYMSRTEEDGRSMTAATLGRVKSHLARTFKTFCPYNKSNPFTMRIKASTDDEVVHREPLTEEEVNLVLSTAEKTDPLMYDLIVCGLCTALRKGDICTLRWQSITDAEWECNGEIKKGSIRLKTRKTGEPVNIPIFPLFGIVLTKRQCENKKKSEFVFPEAALLYKNDPSALTRRIKQVFAQALAEKSGAYIEDAPDDTDMTPKEALPVVLKAVEDAKIQANTKANILKFMPLYASGKSYREIRSLTGAHLVSISHALTIAERISKTRFIATSRKPKAKASMEALVRKVTRKQRKVGLKCASTYDFHCLRTTFVTIAAKHKVPLETVRLITGHTDTRMLEQYYNRAQGIDVASAFAKALPSILTQDIPTPMLEAHPSQALVLPNSGSGRSQALKAMAGFLASKQLTAKEKKQLMQAMLASDD